jgi:predicted RNA binding protein YcfA (HicA-like mRNA interferase family)
MANLNAKDVKSALLKKGFKQSEGHHHFFEFKHGDKVIAKTKMSHNDQDIGDNLISKMFRQCQMNKKKEFIDFVDCTVSQEDYVQILRNKKLI